MGGRRREPAGELLGRGHPALQELEHRGGNVPATSSGRKLESIVVSKRWPPASGVTTFEGPMQRRHFLELLGLGVAGLALPSRGGAVSASSQLIIGQVLLAQLEDLDAARDGRAEQAR